MKTSSTIKAFDGTNTRIIELYDDPSDVASVGQYAFAVQADSGVTLYGAMDKGTLSPQVLKCVDSNDVVHTIHKSASEGPQLNYFYTSTQGMAQTFTLDGASNFRRILVECKSGSMFHSHDLNGGLDVYFTLSAVPKAGGNPTVISSGYLYGGGGGTGYVNNSTHCSHTQSASQGTCTCWDIYRCTYIRNKCSCQVDGLTGGHGAKCTYTYDVIAALPSIDIRDYNFIVELSFAQDPNKSGINMSCGGGNCSVGCTGQSGGCSCNASSCQNSCDCLPGYVGVSYDGHDGGTPLVPYETCDMDPVEGLDERIAFVKIYTS